MLVNGTDEIIDGVGVTNQAPNEDDWVTVLLRQDIYFLVLFPGHDR